MGHVANQKWKAKKLKLLVEANYKCCYCGMKMDFETATIDHIIPKSKGGGNIIDNLAICCSPCNIRKGNKILICQVLPKYKKKKKPKKRRHGKAKK